MGPIIGETSILATMETVLLTARPTSAIIDATSTDQVVKCKYGSRTDIFNDFFDNYARINRINEFTYESRINCVFTVCIWIRSKTTPLSFRRLFTILRRSALCFRMALKACWEYTNCAMLLTEAELAKALQQKQRIALWIRLSYRAVAAFLWLSVESIGPFGCTCACNFTAHRLYYRWRQIRKPHRRGDVLDVCPNIFHLPQTILK